MVALVESKTYISKVDDGLRPCITQMACSPVWEACRAAGKLELNNGRLGVHYWNRV